MQFSQLTSRLSALHLTRTPESIPAQDCGPATGVRTWGEQVPWVWVVASIHRAWVALAWLLATGKMGLPAARIAVVCFLV